VDEFEPRIRELLEEFPTMRATVIAERVGWARGMTVLTARVRELRPVYLAPDPASRTAYLAGGIAQNDFWFPDIWRGDAKVRLLLGKLGLATAQVDQVERHFQGEVEQGVRRVKVSADGKGVVSPDMPVRFTSPNDNDPATRPAP
jgi:hypothetical protein